MRRLVFLVVPVAAVLLALVSVNGANAQAPLTVTLPAGPPGQINAVVNGQACGSATTSATGTTTLTISAACATAGATISFTGPGGVALADTLTVPAGGSGALTLPSLDPANPVTINVPAGPGGTVTATVNGQACGTATVTPDTMGTISLPATCAAPNSTISFTGSGGTPLASSLTVPATGGGNLTLPNLNATNPVTITLPAGQAGTINASVDGQACGSATVSSTASTTLTLSGACATPGGTITLSGAGGSAVAGTNLMVPASGGAALNVASLNSGTNVTLPAGTGTYNFFVNGQACGSATLNEGATTTTALPATCATPNGTLTIRDAAGATVGSPLTVPASGAGSLTVPSLSPQVSVIVPSGPAGMITALVNGQICGSTNVTATTTSTITLAESCVIPGAMITFTGANNAPLSSSLMVPAGGGTVALTNLNAASPVNITIPGGGSGRLDVRVNGNTCATVNLGAAQQTVSLPATCMVANGQVTFTGTGGNYPGTGEQLNATLRLPATGGGTLTLTSLASPSNPATVPAPAPTGNGGYLALTEDGASSTFAIALALIMVASAGAGSALVLRARR